MLAGYKKRVNGGVGLGLLLQVVGFILIFEEPPYGDIVILMGILAFLVGMVLFIYGLCMYAKGKGRNWMWGFLGLFNLVGLVILSFLKPLPAKSIDIKLSVDKKKMLIAAVIAILTIAVFLFYYLRK